MSFDDGCEEMYQKVFSDSDPTSWLLFGYAGRKITPQKSGEGGLEDLIADFDDSQVQYALLRLTKMDDGGDSKRTKFIFITWVGEDAPALKKGMVNMHKDTVGGLFKGFHIEKAIYERGDLDSLSEELDSKLKAAAGANYDLGNIRTGATGAGSLGYKTKSKEFFMQKDSESEIKDVQYDKFLRQGKEVMDCDISGRAMVAPPSEAKRNTVGYHSASYETTTGGGDEASAKSEEKEAEKAIDTSSEAAPEKKEEEEKTEEAQEEKTEAPEAAADAADADTADAEAADSAAEAVAELDVAADDTKADGAEDTSTALDDAPTAASTETAEPSTTEEKSSDDA